MAKVSQAAKVGLFVVVSSTLLFLVVRTVDKKVGSGEGYFVHAFLKDATGLATHSRVTIAGIPVGHIDAIRLEGGRARLEIRVKQGVDLYQDARLGIRSASLLGENIVVIEPGSVPPKLPPDSEIKTMPDPKSIDDIKETVGRVAELVEKVAEQLAASVGTDEGGRNMKAILRNLAEATDALNKTIRENREVIHETLLSVDSIAKNSAPQLDRILENVRVITDDVKVLVDSGRGGSGAELKETLTRVNRASKSLESAVEHVDSIAAGIDRGEGTIGRLTKDEKLINEVEGVAEGVNDYVDRITRLQTIVGLRSDYNFLANTVKSYVELRLQPREDRYYVIELINDPRGKTSFTQTDVDTTNPNDPAHYRTITTTTTDAFRFTIQFAKRLGPFTGRFGLKESTGGVGLDVHLLQNRFEIVNDLFGFSEELQPRYRLWVGYEFLNRLWLLGGVDHVFLANRRDYFLGLQLRFNDDDLKTILPFAGGVGAASN